MEFLDDFIWASPITQILRQVALAAHGSIDIALSSRIVVLVLITLPPFLLNKFHAVEL